MIQNETNNGPSAFAWTEKRSAAAGLVAEDRLSDREIAQQLGVGRATLARWKCHPAFQQRVKETRDELTYAVTRALFASKEARVQALQHRLDLLWQVIERRAERGGSGPGAKTGIMIRKFRQWQTKECTFTEENWVVDVRLLAEMRAIERQIAREMGQWVERRQHSGDPERPLAVQHHGAPAALPPGYELIKPEDLTVVELEAIRNARQRRAAGS